MEDTENINSLDNGNAEIFFKKKTPYLVEFSCVWMTLRKGNPIQVSLSHGANLAAERCVK